MADITDYVNIDGLPPADNIFGAEMMEVLQAGVNRRATAEQVVQPLKDALADPDIGASLVSAGIRTQKNKNSDILSVRDKITTPIDGTTSNQEGILSAVAEAKSLGEPLFWPRGTYVSTGNIPGFWDVKHYGPGIIKRGDIYWSISPKDQDVQSLFVSSSGGSDNDGLTPDIPFTYQQINKALLSSGPVLDGDWRVYFAAGTYAKAVIDVPNITMAGRKLLKFIGPPVAKREVPLVTFDGENTITIGARARGQHRVEIRDIAFFRYRDYGFSGGSQGIWFMNNVHTRDCRIGIAGENVGLLYVSSGVHDLSPDFDTSSVENHRIMSRFVVKHAIGYSYDEISGNPVIDPPEHLPILRGFNRSGGSRGFLAQELATGHVNIDAQDFAYGIDVRVSSRAHVDATSTIKKNAYGIRAGFGCNCQIQPAIDFGVGTSDENTIENVSFQGGADGNYSQPFMHQELRVAYDNGSYNVTGTTASTKIGQTLYTLRSRDFKSEGGLRLRVSGSISGTTGRKTISLMGRTTTLISAVIAASSSGQFVAELKSDVKGYGRQHGQSTYTIGGDTNQPGSSGGRTRDTTLKFGLEEYPIELRVELQSGSDSISIESIELWRIG